MKENLGEIKQSLDGLKHVVEQRMAEKGTEHNTSSKILSQPQLNLFSTENLHILKYILTSM